MTTELEINLETIQKNFETFKKEYASIASIRQRDEEASLTDELEERIMSAPASTRIDLVCAYPGGLVEHTLRVFSIMRKYNAGIGANLDDTAISVTALIHDIGKIGYGRQDYYHDCESDWHRNKLGMMYEVNPKLAHWTPSQLSLMFAAWTGINLEPDEWYAISSIRDTRKDDHIPAQGNEPMLAVVLQQAVKIATIQGKNKQSPSIITL